MFDRVPEGRRHIIVYEDFYKDPGTHYAAVLDFLGLPPDDHVAFTLVNPAIAPRSRRLERLLRKPPSWIKALSAPARPIFRAVGFNPVRTAWSLNSVVRQKAALTPAFRADLDHYFAEDIAHVEQLLGRQLWRDLRPTSPRSIATNVGTAA